MADDVKIICESESSKERAAGRAMQGVVHRLLTDGTRYSDGDNRTNSNGMVSTEGARDFSLADERQKHTDRQVATAHPRNGRNDDSWRLKGQKPGPCRRDERYPSVRATAWCAVQMLADRKVAGTTIGSGSGSGRRTRRWAGQTDLTSGSARVDEVQEDEALPTQDRKRLPRVKAEARRGEVMRKKFNSDGQAVQCSAVQRSGVDDDAVKTDRRIFVEGGNIGQVLGAEAASSGQPPRRNLQKLQGMRCETDYIATEKERRHDGDDRWRQTAGISDRKRGWRDEMALALHVQIGRYVGKAESSAKCGYRR
ncbi:hypothetical protein LX32DRAFT_649878 [Colletotrichum zoysiae]|uniref:Uncharacterized protein n=1 Tax=Colletotrichum zoysiae TaxID=1216348 RepID=A0AAD9HP38_9PEZI|nr:hypothetical protein LX32DRAFT_649878 [Colletotrichum zoysiae]